MPSRTTRALLALFFLGLFVLTAGGGNATPSYDPQANWSGTCDSNYWNAAAAAKGWTGSGAHPLGASYLGVPACGPRPGPQLDGAPDVTKPFGRVVEVEWECPELAFRFMAKVYGVDTYYIKVGADLVRDYSPEDGGGLVVVNNGTPGVAPLPGDVISFDAPDNVGHVGVIVSSLVDGSGNGKALMMSENSDPTGWSILTVTGWTVQKFAGEFVPYGWLHDPSGRGGSGQPDPGSDPPSLRATAPTSAKYQLQIKYDKTCGSVWPGAPKSGIRAGMNVFQTARPKAACRFVTWKGISGCSAKPVCRIPMTQSRSVTAVFARKKITKKK